MSELAHEARRKMHEKAQRLVRSDPTEPVDASGYRPDGALDGDVQTGERPISRRQFRKGGKVVHAEGKHARHHVGHAPRRTGRKTGGKALVDEFTNRNVRAANEERDGIKHVGGFKRGGKADGGSTVPTQRMSFQSGPSQLSKAAGLKRGGHVDEHEDRELVKKMVRPKALTGKKDGGKAGHWIADAVKHPGALHRALHVPEGEKIPAKKLSKAEHSENPHLRKEANLAKTLKGMHHKAGGAAIEHGGREARAHGGKAGKGKMNVNIIIGAGHPSQGGAPMTAPAPPQGPPRTAPVPMPPPQAPMGAMPVPVPMGMGAPPQQPPMPRKKGGRAYPLHDGSGGGEGRLQKVRAYGDEAYD